MKKPISLFLLFCLSLLLTNCFEDYDDNPQYSSLEVKDFIWKALNFTYLYKDNVEDLADDRFSSDEEYTLFLESYDAPQDLFEHLKYMPLNVDRFSRLFPDYFALEQLLNGTTVSNGMEFSLYYKSEGSNELFGVVKMVLPNSSASSNNLQRGDLFDQVNGNQLYYNSETDNNLDLFNTTSYSITLAAINDNGTPETTDDTIESTSEVVNLTKVPYDENPVYIADILEVNGGEKLGYLLYNGFYPNYDNQLNDAFGYFQANNIQHLVIDLRYNGGGNVQTAAYLGSMVTGQFNGQVFAKTLYNENLANNNSEYRFTNSIGGGGSIHSLNLAKVYIITTQNTASASEMIVNSLSTYIDVIQVGEVTVGKSQVSRIVYDSPELFNRNNVNPNHTYAMLPLIGISVNSNNGQVPSTGLVPNQEYQIGENAFNLGTLGNPSEPLLATVITDIENTGKTIESSKKIPKEVKTPGKELDFILFE